MDKESNQQPKQERSRQRWTPFLDTVFADLVVKQIQLGNRQNNVFDKKTWNNIRDEFNEQTDLNFNNNQLRKHLDVLRQRYKTVKSSYEQNDFAIEDTSCVAGFDLWEEFGVQPRCEPVKVKDCPIFEQLCTIFADNSVDGKYAQSSHFEGLDEPMPNRTSGFLKSEGVMRLENPSTPNLGQGNAFILEKDSPKQKPDAKTSLAKTQVSPAALETMADALFDMASALKSRMAASTPQDDRFSITNCINALDGIENVDESVYFAALDLFESPGLRETFLSLKGNRIRLTWLQCKCRKLSPSQLG